MSETTIQNLEPVLERLRKGDHAAKQELVTLAYGRLKVLASKMLNRFGGLRPRGEETGDVLHGALLRLLSALDEVAPNSVREFLGLAAAQVRRELIDLNRHYYGRPDRKQPKPKQVDLLSDADRGEDTYEPHDLAVWAEFHKAVESLPAKEREVVELLWYLDLSQQETAQLLQVDASTVKRRWREAKLKLHQALEGWLPEM